MDNTEPTFEQLISQLQVHESEDQLVVGLDFGTTFSGIAYAFRKDDKPELVSILDWPGLEGQKQPKVPTIISYDPADPTSFTWGAQQHEYAPVEGIKLLLDPDQEKPLYVPATNTKAELKKVDKPPVEVAADYIEAMYKHAMSRIESKVPLQYLQMCQKKFVLSVPAVWSDKAKDTTMRAAKHAGIFPATLIKEPEAAALYTLHVLQERALAVGDAIVICDAGGGTVDLISYEISRLHPKLELSELVGPKGGMAGSLQLNRRFEQAVSALVGEDQYYHLRKTRAYADAVKTFDQLVKPAFRGSSTPPTFINFPRADLQDDEANGLKDNAWELTSGTVEDIFKPLTTDIKRLVEDQVNLIRVKRHQENHPKADAIKAIFLVGGFGNSEYLKNCIQEAHPEIQVIQPHDAWSAIVKGAVLSQLPHEAIVTSTVAPRHYGVVAFAIFDEVEDAGEAKTRDDSTGKWLVKKMTWYIAKNEDLKRDQKVRFPFYRSIPAAYEPAQLLFEDELVTDESVRPTRYPREGLTRVNCALTADLRKVDPANFKKRTGVDGLSYVDVYYDLVVAVRSAQMKFSLEIAGTEMGSVDANYD